MFQCTEAIWGYNSRYLPSTGRLLTDAELNEKPLPRRVGQHLVDALWLFIQLSTSENSRRTKTLSRVAARTILWILKRFGIEVDIF